MPKTPSTPTEQSFTSSTMTMGWTDLSDLGDIPYAYDIYKDNVLVGTNTRGTVGTATSRNLPSTTLSARGIVYTGTYFVVVAPPLSGVSNSNTVWRSTDGVNWTLLTPSVTLASSSAVYTNLEYLNSKLITAILTSTTSIYTSSDEGATWSATTVPSMTGVKSFAYGNGIWLATKFSSATTNQYIYSTDGGTTWIYGTISVPSAANSFTVTFGNGYFVALPSTGTSIATGYRSTDGITWTSFALPSASSYQSISYGNGRFVASRVSSTAVIMSTDNGDTWTVSTAANFVSRIKFYNGFFYGVPGSGPLYYSSDGITWSTLTLLTLDANQGYFDFALSASTIVAMATINASSTTRKYTTFDYTSAPSVSYSFSGLDTTPHNYTVSAVNPVGTETAKSAALVWPPVPPAVPATPSLAQPTGVNKNVVVSWLTVSGATSYVIYRGTTAGALTQIGTSATLTYTDTSVTVDGIYYYAVASVGNATSAQSTSASIVIDRAFTNMSML